MALVIDKRHLPKNNSIGSREKFLKRHRKAIKNRVKEIVKNTSIKDVGKGSQKVKISKKDLNIPDINFDLDTGNKTRVYVGNKKYHRGDSVDKPTGGKGQGNGGSPDGGGEDDFEFVLSDKEFLDVFFEDLALPDMIKKNFLGLSWEIKHAGLSRTGGPSSLNIKRTLINSLGRRVALNAKRKKELEEEKLKAKKKVQYIEELDLRYNFKEKQEEPSTKAVMFCLMDVSGSVSEKQKDMSKRFFILLNMFLRKNYDIVDVVFVRHTEVAEEVDEQKFFYDRQSGGTVVSSGYKKILEIVNQRYDVNTWNIYVAQSTDGDNWVEDMPEAEDLLVNHLLKICQYMAYIDVQGEQSWFGSAVKSGQDSTMFSLINTLSRTYKNLAAKILNDYSDIFPVFRSLFTKEKKK